MTNCKKSKRDVEYVIKTNTSHTGCLYEIIQLTILPFSRTRCAKINSKNIFKNLKHCITLLNLRNSFHTLATCIERGQTNPMMTLEKHICGSCNGFGDEIHRLVTRKVFWDESHVFFTKILERFPNLKNWSTINEFTFLVKIMDPQICAWTSKFIEFFSKNQTITNKWLRRSKTPRS